MLNILFFCHMLTLCYKWSKHRLASVLNVILDATAKYHSDRNRKFNGAVSKKTENW